MKKVPELRLKGFEEEWKETTINRITSSFSGGTPSVSVQDYYVGNIPFIRSGEINSGRAEINISNEGLCNSSAKMVYTGTLLYALYGATSGEVGISKMTGAINQAILALLPNKGIDKFFLCNWLKNRKSDILNTFLQGGQGNLSAEIVKSLEIKLPSEKEQLSIGNFFQTLDNLLSEQQNKLENLQKVKKSMLCKMFPKEGQKVPEIRFKGFDGDWEEKKLSYYLVVSTEKNVSNLYDKNKVLSVSGDFGVINQIEFQGRSFAGASLLNYGIAENRDVIYTKSPLKCNPYGIIKTNKGDVGIVSVLYGIYHPIEVRTNSNFIQTYFEMDSRLNNYLRPLVSKGAKNTLQISDEAALEGKVRFPSVKEQEKISALFTQIDNAITYQGNLLDNLQHIKQSFLSKMFV